MKKMKIVILSLLMASPTFGANFSSKQLGLSLETLSPQKVEELTKYLKSTRADLQKALKDSFGLSAAQELRILKEAIENIVAQSKGGSKLMMATVLFQALHLSVGVKAELLSDQSEFSSPLEESTHTQLKAIILRQSILLALNYYQSDLKAVESGTLSNPPYAKLAKERLQQTIHWWRSIFDASSAISFMNVSLAHISNLIQSDSTQVALMGEELVAIDNLRRELISAEQGLNGSALDEKLWVVRKKILRLLSGVDKKIIIKNKG